MQRVGHVGLMLVESPIGVIIFVVPHSVLSLPRGRLEPSKCAKVKLFVAGDGPGGSAGDSTSPATAGGSDQK